jgi:DNA-binding TFAR19-related protein (PDSD5 family)
MLERIKKALEQLLTPRARPALQPVPVTRPTRPLRRS